MPFDLYVSRATTFAAVAGEPPAKTRRGFLARLLSTPPPEPTDPPRPITSEEFHAVMRDAPSTRKSEHTYWVRQPDGDPWFVGEWKTDGHVLLSTSYSNHRFLRNFADMFDQGLRIAAHLGAHLFEEVGGREVTKKNIDSLLRPRGRYVALQAGTWRRTIENLDASVTAPLEYPLGPIDCVSEYLVFHVLPQRSITDDSVVGLLEGGIDGVKLQAAGAGAWCAVEADGERWLSKVLRRPDGKWQVWPAWGRSPFARVAEVTVGAAEHLHGAAGGEIQFLGRPYDLSLREDVHSRIGGLGIEFYTWTQTLRGQGPPAGRAG